MVRAMDVGVLPKLGGRPARRTPTRPRRSRRSSTWPAPGVLANDLDDFRFLADAGAGSWPAWRTRGLRGAMNGWRSTRACAKAWARGAAVRRTEDRGGVDRSVHDLLVEALGR